MRARRDGLRTVQYRRIVVSPCIYSVFTRVKFILTFVKICDTITIEFE